MTTPPAAASAPTDPPISEPVYSESELYDSPADLIRWPRLAPLLKTWQTEVWERDHTEFRGCWRYDQDAIRLQKKHRWAVIPAAMAGTLAVILAILQLSPLPETLKSYLEPRLADWSMPIVEIGCLAAVIVIFLWSTMQSLDHRWRELRFKAEHYRMLKFRFLHDAAVWLQASEEERGLHLFKHLALIHSANREKIKKWIHWKVEMLPMLQTPEIKPDAALAGELAEYFRERRIEPQRIYFKDRGRDLHRVERKLRWIGPGLFWGSIACAIVHFGLHIVHQIMEPSHHPPQSIRTQEKTLMAAEKALAAAEKTLAAAEKALAAVEKSGAEKGAKSQASPDIPKKPRAVTPPKETQETKMASAAAAAKGNPQGAHPTVATAVGGEEETKHSSGDFLHRLAQWMFALALAAAILPAVAAGLRTWRGAFEFGRNSLRFESMSHHLEHLLEELQKAKSSDAILALLRRGEYAMENEHRAWMRLMMEAEWIG